jgi:hypothetical protein
VILVAKYTKVFPRTGTLPFFFAGRFYSHLVPLALGHIGNL